MNITEDKIRNACEHEGLVSSRSNYLFLVSGEVIASVAGAYELSKNSFVIDAVDGIAKLLGF